LPSLLVHVAVLFSIPLFSLFDFHGGPLSTMSPPFHQETDASTLDPLSSALYFCRSSEGDALNAAWKGFVGYATKVSPNDYPMLPPSLSYNLQRHSPRYHHLRPYLVRSFLNFVLMLHWGWIVNCLPVHKPLVCKGASSLVCLGPLNWDWFKLLIMLVWLNIGVCYLMLFCSILCAMTGSFTLAALVYYLIQKSLCTVTHGHFGICWVFDDLCCILVSKLVYSCSKSD